MNYLGLEQGLSNNNVNKIYQDSFGFIWFGTFDGLNRYDGYNFKKFRNKIGDLTSLPDKEVYAIAEDSQRALWVGTSQGLGVFNNKTFNFSLINYKLTINARGSQKIDQRIYDIKFDLLGNGYIASANSGLLVLSKNRKEAIKIPLGHDIHRSYTVTAILLAKDHAVWLLIDNLGLCRYDPVLHRISVIEGFSWTANAIVSGIKNDLWIGTNKGLYSYNKGKFKPFLFNDTRLQSCRIYAVKFDKQNRLWVATDGEGVTIIDPYGSGATQTLRHTGTGTLSSNIVHDLYFDSESRQWIGTLGGGINILDKRKSQFSSIAHEPNMKNSLAESTVHSICEDNRGAVWIGTDGGGLSIWDRRTNTFHNYIHHSIDPYSISSDRISAIIRDEQGDMWIGTHGSGVSRYDRPSGRFMNVPFMQADSGQKYISRLFMDRQHQIWAGCIKGRFAGHLQRGLFKLNKVRNIFEECSFPIDAEVFAINEDHDGKLLIGGLNKFFRIDPVKGETTTYPTGSIIRAIRTDHTGAVWLGTYSKGLMRFDSRTKRFKSYTENEGLCNNTVLNIEEDQQENIWVSTYNGLSRLDPVRQKIDNFYAVDGLQSNQFFYNASARLHTGELAFGGIKGLTYFQPELIRQYGGFPPLITTSIQVANDQVNADSEYILNSSSIYHTSTIRLPYDKAILTIEYVALEYSKPDKIKYAYILDGRDKGWNYVDNIRVINYSRLNEGHYQLRIKSTNSSGIWNKQERQIDITVLPPWYRTWYASLIYLVSGTGAIYFYIIYHKKQARLKYEIELANLKTQQEKELNEKKLSFFTNISHELRAPLTLIANPVKELLDQNGRNFDLIDLSSVYRNTRRLLSMVDQLLLFRKTEQEISDFIPEHLSIKDVAREVFLCFNNQVKSKQIEYTFNAPSDDLFVLGDREKLEIVLFNVLSNAIKYTQAAGHVTMSINKEDQQICISIADDGPGIPIGSHDKLFDKFYKVPGKRETAQSGFGIGLFLAKKLVDVHQGSITFESDLQSGTVFIVRIPESVAVGSTSCEHPAMPLESMMQEIFPDISIHMDEQTAAGQHSLESLSENMVSDKPVILLIDDDDELRKYVRQLLIGTYHVYEVNNADAGFNKVVEIEPDVVVCDVVMEGMSGVEFCTKMKESPRFSYIPIILLTSTSSPDIKLKGIECGADDYITKPFESSLLLARIKGILKGRQTLKSYFLNEITLRNNTVKVPEEYRFFLAKCIEIIERHLNDEEFNVKIFAAEMGMSHSNLFKKIKSISGLTINEFIRFIRLRKAAELMIKTEHQIKEIVFMVGFQQVRYFREQFHKVFNLNPSDFIARHRNNFADHHMVKEKLRKFNKT